jgi:hypothetical protein
LHVLLRCTATYYSFCIFKLFFHVFLWFTVPE